MEQYTDEEIFNKLMELSLGQLVELKNRFNLAYPQDRHYRTLCEIALRRKMTDDKYGFFMNLMEDIKKAPVESSAPQGKINKSML